MVIRLLLSHVTAPGTPEKTADDIAWIAEQVLRYRER